MVIQRRPANAMAPDPAAIANAMAAQQPPSAGNQPQKVTFVARGIDPKMLERAKKMKKEGGGYGRRYGFLGTEKDRKADGKDTLAEEIWKETGLWEYQPDVWLKEIPDNTASVNAPLPSQDVLGPLLGDSHMGYRGLPGDRQITRIPGPGEARYSGNTLAKGPMSEIIPRGPNDELYKLYPELKNIPVEVFNDYIFNNDNPRAVFGGYLQRETGNVYLGKARNTEDNLRGRSTATDTDQQIRNALANSAVHETSHIVNMLDYLRAEKPNIKYDYRGSEVLGRLVEARRNLTEQQRREIPPMYTSLPNWASEEEEALLKYKEDTNPDSQSPKRWDKEDVQSAPLLYGPYGVTKPKRSVKKPDPKRATKY